MLSFALPDLLNPLDVLMAISGVLFLMMSFSANMYELPFLSRSGGLMAYSKFAANIDFGILLPSKIGMALMYFPPMLMCIVCYFGALEPSLAGTPSSLMGAIHFGKRTLECIFLHRFSGNMPLATSIFVSSMYIASSIGLCFYFDLDVNAGQYYLGIVLFIIGVGGK